MLNRNIFVTIASIKKAFQPITNKMMVNYGCTKHLS